MSEEPPEAGRGAVVNERGQRLIALHSGPVRAAALAQAAQVSLVLARHPDGIVLVRNAGHGFWELPGGYVDPGETAMQCALRELHEEAGLAASEGSLLAVAEIETPAPRPGLLTCAVFGSDAGGEPVVTGNEISDVAFWQPGCDIGPISAIDDALLRVFTRTAVGDDCGVPGLYPSHPI